MTKFQELKSRLRSEYPDQKDALDAADAIEELEAALRMFAEMGDPYKPHIYGDYYWLRTQLGDLRNARAVLGEDK